MTVEFKVGDRVSYVSTQGRIRHDVEVTNFGFENGCPVFDGIWNGENVWGYTADVFLNETRTLSACPAPVALSPRV